VTELPHPARTNPTVTTETSNRPSFISTAAILLDFIQLAKGKM
jgi:hypothetical protein